MIVPWQEPEPETLDNLIQEFVSRDGTDYGEQEYSQAAEKACKSGGFHEDSS